MTAKLTKQEKENLLKEFAKFDANHDGVISKDEFAKGDRNKEYLTGEADGLANMLPEDGGRLFDGLDQDKDGKITLGEFVPGQSGGNSNRTLVIALTLSLAALSTALIIAFVKRRSS